jgi:HSP20 family protein
MNNLIRRTNRPFTGVIENFFDDPFFGPMVRSQRGPATSESWIPSVDLAQTDDEYIVTADLPGMSKKDIDLTVENNILTLSGERSFERKEDGPRFDRIERAYGKFSRTFHLPTNVDVNAVKATFEEGVLTVTIPKAEEAKSRQIEIS